MINESMEYAQYFQPEQEVRIGIHLVDNKFLDDCASIMFIEEDCIHIELDRDVPVGVVMKRGAESVITSLGGWMYCRCRAVLEETLARRELKLRFRGPVIIRQQREYFR